MGESVSIAYMHFCCMCLMYVCRLIQLLLLLLHPIYLNLPVSLLPVVSPLLLPQEKIIKNTAIHAERIKILDFSLFFPLTSESVAKQLLSGSAREHGIWYQPPSYLCEQSPQSNFHGV